MGVGRRIDEAEWQRWSRPVCPRMHLVVALAGNLPLPLWLPGDTRQRHYSQLPGQCLLEGGGSVQHSTARTVGTALSSLPDGQKSRGR